jgi:EmrB/QacA subfamily drug resistance transporter
MATLDSSIVNIALPTLTRELGPGLQQVKWVVIAYLLVITCLLLPFGRLSDQYGRKTVFQAGFLVFVAGSTLCGISPSLQWLLAARVLQALGAAMLMANGPAIITATFPSTERGGALGTLAMVVSAGLISGPSIGGMLITSLGWRAIFLVNVPMGLLGFYLVQRHLQPDALLPKARTAFDWAGALLQSLFLLSFIVIFDPPSISISGGLPFAVSRWMMVAISAAFFALFIKVESQAAAPLFDLSLMKNRVFWAANLAAYLTFVAFSSVSVLMPFFLQEVLHFEPHVAGAFMTAIPLTILVVAPVAGKLSDRFGSLELSFLGALIGALGLFCMAGVVGTGMDDKVSRVGIMLGLASIGIGTGLFQSPNNNAIMSVVPQNKLGVASALLATIRNLGLVTGTGLATSLFYWRMSATSDFVSSLHLTQTVAGVVAVGAMVAAAAKGRGHRNRPAGPVKPEAKSDAEKES